MTPKAQKKSLNDKALELVDEFLSQARDYESSAKRKDGGGFGSSHMASHLRNLATACRQKAQTIRDLVAENEKYKIFMDDLLDPDMYGHAVNSEIRDCARELIGLKMCETKQPEQETEG